jgi:hypothetical protein
VKILFNGSVKPFKNSVEDKKEEISALQVTTIKLGQSKKQG